MAGKRSPGPICRPGQGFTAWVLDEGTMCRQQTPMCGPIGDFERIPHAPMCHAIEAPPAADDPSELVVMTREEFVAIVKENGAVAARIASEYKWLLTDAPPLAGDIKDLSKLLREMGIRGKATLRVVKGKPYVVLSGYAGLRNILTGTRYRPNNVKILDLAIGRAGLARATLRTTRLSIILTVGADVLEAILSQDENLRRTLGLTIGIDVSKEVVAAVAGYAAAVAIAGVSSVAVLPLAGGIVVAVAVGYILDKYVPTESLLRKIEQAYDDFMRKGAGFLQQFEREILRQALPGGTQFPY